MTLLLSVWGIAPGAGKSTLCEGLCARLAGAGLRVDHFREEEILTRPEFAQVAEEFRGTGAVELPTLLEATARFADAIRAAGDDVVVADALLPFVPTLLAMGHGDRAVAAFTRELAEKLAALSIVLIYLDGSAGTALARAAEREGPQWLDDYIGKLARYEVQPPVRDLASATAYLRRERAVTLAAARRMGWPVIGVEGATGLTPGEVLAIAEHGLRPWVVGLQGQEPSDGSG
jgi:thymidylate kinase